MEHMNKSTKRMQGQQRRIGFRERRYFVLAFSWQQPAQDRKLGAFSLIHAPRKCLLFSFPTNVSGELMHCTNPMNLQAVTWHLDKPVFWQAQEPSSGSVFFYPIRIPHLPASLVQLSNPLANSNFTSFFLTYDFQPRKRESVKGGGF